MGTFKEAKNKKCIRTVVVLSKVERKRVVDCVNRESIPNLSGFIREAIRKECDRLEATGR